MGILSDKAHEIALDARETLSAEIESYLRQKGAIDENSALILDDLNVSVYINCEEEIFRAIGKKLWVGENRELFMQFENGNYELEIDDLSSFSFNELYTVATNI